ncbi:protein sym-1-like [Pyrus ussuriensis x Pyrus communis]|uniref:Protein sym-1-like n=1 Tax=Pyrus ussuriensis x Pyrus communis TaxID=2448454 RepID=A0A5N5HY04_9ROSA|nr:protein sym-1-like [Pyrus ussuriensis x Pyrus communis]
MPRTLQSISLQEMALNPASLTRKTPLLNPFVGSSRRPSLHSCTAYRIAANPVQIWGFRSTSVCQSHPHALHSHSFSLNSGIGVVLKDLGRSELGLRQLGYDRFRLSVVSDGGSGGTGGDGGSGDGNYGGRGEGGANGEGGGGGRGENNWSLLSWYLDLLAKYPVATKALTSALLTLIGDMVCQLVIDKAPYLDLKRTFLFTLMGLVLVGPTLHFWYLYLSKLVTTPGASGAFLRLVLDQFLFAPTFIGVFLSTLMTLEGKPSQVVPKLQQEWFSAVLVNWQLWIPFQFLNFRFVPQQFQVLTANFIALTWNVILSFKAHKEVLQK